MDTAGTGAPTPEPAEHGGPGTGALVGTDRAPTAPTAPTAHAVPVSRDTDADTDLARLRAEIRDLRAKLRSRPVIAQAQGVLQERYRLGDERTAFGLLHHTAQRHNLRVRALAEAVVAAPRPRPGREWFPGRARHTPPPLGALAGPTEGRPTVGAVLGNVLSRTLEINQTGMGNVQLVDAVSGGLRMEKHAGLTDDFVDFFDHVEAGPAGTSCSRAAQDVAQVTVRDVATDPVFTEPARRTILAAGSRGAHSTPLVTAAGRCVGMVSTHHDRPITPPGRAAEAALARLGLQSGRWLAWHQHTVVLDALEELHRRGTGETDG
ncbi:ANTAR domain-containing protein [Streptomyces sp. NPDC007088]|uniref:ANTAR domain-containing protein n=1 Tax=Streptomyces sp. NPDC007088 TaxID=3364773 RepID=UPI0036AD0666